MLEPVWRRLGLSTLSRYELPGARGVPRRSRTDRAARLRPDQQGRGKYRRRPAGPRQGASAVGRQGHGTDRGLPRRVGAGQLLGVVVPAVPPGVTDLAALFRAPP